MNFLRIRFISFICLIIIPLIIFSQYNEDIQITTEWPYKNAIMSDSGIIHIMYHTYGGNGIKRITLDTLLNQTSMQSYSWTNYAYQPCVDENKGLVGIAWINGSVIDDRSIMGTVFHSSSEPDSNSAIQLSDSISFSFHGTTHSTPAISFLNDTLLVAIWIQADPDIYHMSIFGQLFTSSNNLIGSNFKISDQYREEIDCGHRPIVHSFHSDSGFVVVWMDHPNKGGELYGRIFNLDGTAKDSSFSITGDCQHYIAGLVYFSMDMDSSDNILTSFSAWDDSYKWKIFYRWLDKNGVPLTDIDSIPNINYRIREMTEVNCNISHDGRSIITWRTFNDNERIFCQRFDSERSLMGEPFCVSHSNRLTSQKAQHSFIYRNKIYSLWNESMANWGSIVDFYNTPVSTEKNLSIKDYRLSPNYPNPFNPTTTISYQLSANSNIELAIYNLSGRKIREWSYQDQSAGIYEITWNGKDQASNPVPSGVYIYRMVAGEFVKSRKMVLLK